MDGMDFDFDFDSEGFDLDLDLDLGLTGGGSMKKNRYVLPKIDRERKNIISKYRNAEKFADELSSNILAGDRVSAVIGGDFIFGDFIEAFLVKNNLLAKSITISTLSISADNVDSLKNLIDGDYVENLNMIVSGYFWANNRQNMPYVFDNLDVDDKFQLAVADIHTKIVLIELESGQKIVINGSANFRSTKCIEEFSIETSKEIYDFHKEWHDSIIEDFGVINKTVRGERLYGLVIKNTEDKKKWQRNQKKKAATGKTEKNQARRVESPKDQNE